jgi:UDP-N-acetylmuramoylalanine--D-glutamate ligase
MKIAVAGYAVEGKSNFNYFKRHGHDVTIIDERSSVDTPEGAPVQLGDNAFEDIKAFDMVVRTASMPPAKLKFAGATKIWSAANEFMSRCPAPVIGVTGTKGKGTTASFITSILRAAGKKVHLVGNIGVAPLDVLDDIAPEDVVVYELSSFQLWDLERSPQVAVVLIARFQRPEDTVVYYTANPYSTGIANASAAKKVPYQTVETAYVKDAHFYYGNQKLCSVDVIRLPGKHNLDNACAAICAAWQFTQDPSAIREGLGSFAGLPHRLKFVRTVDRVDYYDDSIATTPGSVVAAIDAFDQPKILILGGSSKGVTDFSPIAKAAARSNVKAVVLIGDQANMIEKALTGTGVLITNLGSDIVMHDIVRTVHRQARPGDVVILSPACASFGMFENYSDRGDQFVTAVHEL